MIKRGIIVFLSLLMVCACSTVNSLLQPDWIYSTPKVSGSVMYVGNGVDSTENAAKDKAYQNIMDKIGKDLGYEISSQYFRELVATDHIASLSTTITDHYSYQQSNGEWNYYAIARTAQNVLLDSRSSDYIDLLAREAEIKIKLDEALALYQDNMDIDAINKVLEAMVISLQGNVNNPDYTPNALLEKALEYLDNIRISLSKASSSSIGVTVKVKRAKGLFHPSVEMAKVDAEYSMMNINGDIIQGSIECRTNEKGNFRFKNTNPYILRDGNIVFSIKLDLDILRQIEMFSSEGFLDDLYKLIEDKKIIYSYNMQDKYSSDDLLFVIALYALDGNQIENKYFEESLRSYLSNAGLQEYTFVNVYGEEFEDIYYTITEQYPGYRYFVVMRVGVVDYKNYQEQIYSRTEGRVVIYDSLADSEIAIQDSYTVGFGQDEEGASDNSFSNEAKIIAGRLLEEL